MRAILTACALAVAAVLAQDVLPGRPVYHAGWYNVVIMAVAVFAALQLRKIPAPAPERTGLVFVILGTAVMVFAGVASGLLGPDLQTVVGAPGASVRAPGVPFAVDFPLARDSRETTVPRRRYSGSFIVQAVARSVVRVSAFDKRGNRLTVTQPAGAAFLSPVLLMRTSTVIAGMTLPFDTFAVPAARRTVKAVLFTKQQAGQLRSRQALAGQAAVLFAVSGPDDRIVPGGISIVADGGQKAVGGLTLSAHVIEFPAFAVSSAPNSVALLVGLALLGLGGFLLRKRPL
ncbi:MAG: LPXTG cell wall anchor domain-containing protein [Candidatus Eremiobacteraeota bacterium]|nr:LPXTG cell wall anchor domain-containing protein [Candidatus Eremiobacteraeota bacterium]